MVAESEIVTVGGICTDRGGFDTDSENVTVGDYPTDITTHSGQPGVCRGRRGRVYIYLCGGVCGFVGFGVCWGLVCVPPVQLPRSGLPPLCFVSRVYDWWCCFGLAVSSVSRFRGRRLVLRRAHGRSTTFPWVLPRSVLREYGLTLRGAVGECIRFGCVGGFCFVGVWWVVGSGGRCRAIGRARFCVGVVGWSLGRV